MQKFTSQVPAQLKPQAGDPIQIFHTGGKDIVNQHPCRLLVGRWNGHALDSRVALHMLSGASLGPGGSAALPPKTNETCLFLTALFPTVRGWRTEEPKDCCVRRPRKMLHGLHVGRLVLARLEIDCAEEDLHRASGRLGICLALGGTTRKIQKKQYERICHLRWRRLNNFTCSFSKGRKPRIM